MNKIDNANIERILDYVEALPGKASFQMIKLENGSWWMVVTDTEPIFEEVGTDLSLALQKMRDLVDKDSNG